jgi:iron transport multicopper oxidase
MLIIHSVIVFGNDTYITPKVPTLYTALTTGKDALNPIVYGSGVNPYVVQSGEVVQITVENNDNSEHPMHLHGHSFQVIARGIGTWDGSESSLPKYPVVRDVVTTPPSGYLVIRFKADNPGVWMYHCHMVFHLAAGMTVTLIESPDILQRTLTVDQQALDLCHEQKIPTAGNCAGDTVNVLDTSGCNNNPEDENGT